MKSNLILIPSQLKKLELRMEIMKFLFPSSLIRVESANASQIVAEHVIVRLSLINPHNVRIRNDDDSTATQKLPTTKSSSPKLIAQSEEHDNETNQTTDEADSIRIVYLFIALYFLVVSWFHVARTMPKNKSICSLLTTAPADLLSSIHPTFCTH